MGIIHIHYIHPGTNVILLSNLLHDAVLKAISVRDGLLIKAGLLYIVNLELIFVINMTKLYLYRLGSFSRMVNMDLIFSNMI